MTFHDYSAALRFLDDYIPTPGTRVAPDYALARTQALMARLDDPQDALPVLHLAGTSGKGSTAAILASILQAHGLRTGVGTSPHLRHLRERISFDATPVDEATFCIGLGEIAPAVLELSASAWGPPTFFEILIALSYWLFARRPVDVVVMETGLGGRYDATNTVTRADKIAILTPLGLDHTEFLGNTLSKIAAAKAGIIRPGNAVFSAPHPPVAAALIRATCRRRGASLTIFNQEAMLRKVRLAHTGVGFDLDLSAQGGVLRDLWLPTPGLHQAANAGLATLAASRFLQRRGQPLSPLAVAQGLAATQLPGRMEQRTLQGRTVILDGAHNPQKMQALCATLAALYPGVRFPVVMALKQDKSAQAILSYLQPLTAQLLCTRFTATDQGMPLAAIAPEEIAAVASTVGFDLVQTHPDPNAALAAALATPGDAPVIVTGSIYLLAQLYPRLEPAQTRTEIC
jgi:dihydrofolate synthase/folylpolyglutamate synthase